MLSSLAHSFTMVTITWKNSTIHSAPNQAILGQGKRAGAAVSVGMAIT
jgi:hypothetical protein